MTGAASTTTTRDPVKIVANIFISFIGAGVLGLPYAFKRVSLKGEGNCLARDKEIIVISGWDP